LLDRIDLQGQFDKQFSGGSILHLNIDQPIEADQMYNMIDYTAKQGVVYFAINYNLQKCEKGHMSVGQSESCQICGKPITDNYMRVVGFLTNTKNWAPERREQDYPNRVFY